MKPKILLVGLVLVVFVVFSPVYLKNNLAVGQDAPETINQKIQEAVNQNAQLEETQKQIMEKLDKILANQNTILKRLDEIEVLVENTRVRATR